jgi:hypothetical protein
LPGLDHGGLGDAAGMADLTADLGHRRGKLFGRGGDGVDTGRCLPRRDRRCRGPLRGTVDASRDLASHALHVLRRLRDGADHALDVGFEAVGHLPLQRLLLELGLPFRDLLRLA